MTELSKSDTARILTHASDEFTSEISKKTMPLVADVVGRLDMEYSPEDLNQSDGFRVDHRGALAEELSDEQLVEALHFVPDDFSWSTKRPGDGTTYDFEIKTDHKWNRKEIPLGETMFEEWVDQMVNELNSMLNASTLTKRQFEVVVLDGANPEAKIGEVLGLSLGTIRTHKHRAYEKMKDVHYEIIRLEDADEVHQLIRRTGSKDSLEEGMTSGERKEARKEYRGEK